MTQNYPKFVYSFNAIIYFQNISLQRRMGPLYNEFNFKQLTNMYSTASAEPSFEHPSPRFTSTCSLNMTTAIGIFADISGGHRSSISHGSEHRATRCTNTAGPDGRTRWSRILYNLHVQCRPWKTVDRDDSSRATTANPRVRSSRYARVMTTRVNGCSAAVLDRAWIILTTGVRGFMKVPRWLYCKTHMHLLHRYYPRAYSER